MNIHTQIARETWEQVKDSFQKLVGRTLTDDEREGVKKTIRERIDRYNAVEAGGLDIGGVMAYMVKPKEVVNHPQYGLCFKYGKRLYRFSDTIFKVQQ